MHILVFLIGLILHIDQHSLAFVNDHGTWSYGPLFLIVFVETGLAVMPLLPCDSLLFVVGTLSRSGAISLPLAMGVLVFAATAGNSVKNSNGRRRGACVFRWARSRWTFRVGNDERNDARV